MIDTIVAISGKLASGKTTLANAICEAYPPFVRVGFADALKNDVAAHCEVTRQYLDEHKDTFREILQVHGTLMRELHGPDYWVHRLYGEIVLAGHTHVVVDDMRFPSELSGLRKMDGARLLTVRLNISEEEQERRCTKVYGAPLTWAKLHHPSETALDEHITSFDLNMDAQIPTASQVRIVLDMLAEKGLVLAG